MDPQNVVQFIAALLALGAAVMSTLLPLLSRLNDVVNNQRSTARDLADIKSSQREIRDAIETKSRIITEQNEGNARRLRQVRSKLSPAQNDTDTSGI